MRHSQGYPHQPQKTRAETLGEEMRTLLHTYGTYCELSEIYEPLVALKRTFLFIYIISCACVGV